MKVYLIGTGADGRKTLTAEAEKALDEAQIYIGAERMLSAVTAENKPRFCACGSEKIRDYIDAHNEYSCAAVLLSGDISFYSGARRLRGMLGGHKIVGIPGISSLSYMCARLGIPIEETETVSLHGREGSICARVRDSKYTFVLLGGRESAADIAQRLCDFGMGNCVMHIASRLGYDDERIISAAAAEADTAGIDRLCAVMIENNGARNIIGRHIEDDEFIRGGVPMTKSEVRAVSIAKLSTGIDSVVYDIGAGTGSVAIEASLRSHDIKVYAIERSDEGIGLIEKNRRLFGADNVFPIHGSAPEALCGLPAPTNVFIGGSGGRLYEILKAVTENAPSAQIVINTVALNSAAEVLSAAAELGLDYEVTSVTAARSKRIGGYDMMTGLNPVYIFNLGSKL